MEEQKQDTNNVVKGSAEYYRKLCYDTDIELKYYTFGIFEEKFTLAVKEKDYSMIHKVFYHESKLDMLPLWDGGCDHSYCFWKLLDLISCDKFDNIYRLFPEKLPLAENGHSMSVKAVNLMLCMLYNGNEEVYEQSKLIEQAENYVVSKQPKWIRAVLSCILAIIKHNAQDFSQALQEVCEGYSRNDIDKYKKLQCKPAYGLTILAKHFLTEEEFACVEYPKYKNYDKGYIDWFLALEDIPNELCFEYEGEFEEMNSILKMPIVITRIHQPHLGSDNKYISAKAKKHWYLDETGSMLNEFCKDAAKALAERG